MFWAVKLSIKCTLWGTNGGILNFLFDAQPKVIGEVSQSEHQTAKMNTK